MNLEKSILQPVKQTEILGLQINTREMTLSLSEEKQTHNSTMSGGLLSMKNFSVKFDKVFRFHQKGQLSSLKRQGSYQGYVVIGNSARQELLWWTENITLCNGRKIQQEKSQMIIQTDASTKRWGAHCNGISIGRKWLKKEQGHQINVLELMAVKFAILTFTKSPSNLNISR